MKKVFCTMFTLSLVLLLSCGDGSNRSNQSSNADVDSTAYDTSLLKITDVSVPSGTVFKAGRSNSLNLTIDSENSDVVKDIPVSFYIVKNDPKVSDTTESEENTVYSGTYTIPSIQTGTSEYLVNINVPVIESGYGSYQVIACFYDQIMKSPVVDANSNLSDDIVEPIVNENGNKAVLDVPIDPTTNYTPDVYISSASLSSPGLTLFSNRVDPLEGNSLSVTVNLSVLAANVGNASLSFTMQSLDGTINCPLKVVAADNTTTKDNLSIAGGLTKYETKTVTIALKLPDSIIPDLVNYVKSKTASRYEFTIVAKVVSSDETNADLDNNVVTNDFWLVPDPSVILSSSKSRDFGFDWSKSSGNSVIGGGIYLSSHSGMDVEKIYTNSTVKLPLSLLKHDISIVDGALKGQLHYESKPEDDYVSAHLKVFGKSLYNETFSNYSFKTDGVREPASILADLRAVPDGSSPKNVSYWSNGMPNTGSFYYEAEYKYEGYAMVGPIPVTYYARVYGAVGMSGFVYLGTSSAAGFIPYATLGVGGGGGIGIPIAKITVNIDINLITVSMFNAAWFEYDMDMSSENNKSITFKFNEYSRLDSSFLSGRLYLEAKYPGIRWIKKKFIRIPVPCVNTSSLTLFSFDPITTSTDLLPRKTTEFVIPLD
jgi:hypothetical protein